MLDGTNCMDALAIIGGITNSAGSSGPHQKLRVGLFITGWWFHSTHLKNIRQNGFIFPKFRGEN